jgi:hypothetical protein
MSLLIYERNLKYGRTILIAGILMLFEKSIHTIYAFGTGIFMIIFGIIIIIYYNKKIVFEKRKEIIQNFLENNLIIINKSKIKQQKENEVIKSKEIKVIDYFSKQYKLNENKINSINIDKIIYFDINYDNLTLFLDIYTFVKKYDLIIELNFNWNNKLLFDYYQHYYNIIAFISNLYSNSNDTISINIAINYLIEDYYNNAKILDNLIKEILIEKNKLEWLNEKPSDYNNIIKYISTIFNHIINDNFNKFYKN